MRRNGRIVGGLINGRNGKLNGRGGLLNSMPASNLPMSGAALRLDNLTHTVIPVRGDVTPSMTRSATATCVDSWGRQITALAGEVRFPGARRVDNLIRLGAAQSSTLAVAANVTMTLAAGTYIFSMGVGSGRATFSGTGGATGTLDASPSARVEVAKTITAGTLIVTASVATLTDLQVEYVSGQSVQQAASYVSVGVASAPAYHGSMVDGVKCFPTDLSGNPLTGMTTPLIELAATNYCLFSNTLSSWSDVGTPAATQDAVGPNGQVNYAWTLTDNNPAGYEAKALGSITFTAGQNGCFSALVEKKTASPAYPLLLLNHNVTGGIFSGVIVNEVAGTIVNIPAGGQYATPLTSGISSYNDGVKDYWLVWVSATQVGASATAGLQLYPSGSVDGTTLSATAQGSTVFCDAQFEIGVTFPSSRITTAAAPVARSADQFYYTGALIGQLKTLAVRGFKRDVGVNNDGVMASLSDGTLNNFMLCDCFTATSVRFQGSAASATQWNTAASNAYTPGTLSNAAWSAATNDIKMAKDGVAQTPDTVATIPTVTRLEIGMVAGAFQLNGNPGKIYGWTSNLSQSELNGVSA